MKKWFQNLRVKWKLNLIIGVSLAALLLFSLISIYLIRTTKVVNIMLIAQRDYMMDYHKSLEKYYQFKRLQAEGNNESAGNYLDEAVRGISQSMIKLKLFSNIDSTLQKPDEILIPEIIKVYPNAVTDPKTLDATRNASLLVNRMRLFQKLGIDDIQNSSAAAQTASLLADRISEFFKGEQTSQLMDSTQLNRVLAQMESEEARYASSVIEISNKTVNNLVIIILLLLIALGTSIYLLSISIGRMIVRPIGNIRNNLVKMSAGDTSGSSDYFSKDEIGQLADSYREMQTTMVKQLEQAKRVAGGDFNSLLQPRSEKDDLTLALNEMTKALKQSQIKSEREGWIKSRQTEFGVEIQGDLELSSLGTKITNILATQLGALCGALYVVNGKNKLELVAGYAFDAQQAEKRTWNPGEGLIGQAIQNQKPTLVDEIPDGYLDIKWGTGSAKPRYMVILPCFYNQSPQAVVELGTFRPYPEEALEYLSLIAESVAIAIQSSKSRTELQHLFEQQQQLAEELQVQQEELRQTNEELQTQQEELRVTNEELAERTRAIENQKDSLKKKNDELEKARRDVEEKAREIEQVSRYKSEFLANMSHELRTPLNSILVLSQILSQNKDANLTEKQIKSAQTIKSSGENLLVLINEILDLSKIESGRVELHPEVLEISGVISDLKESFHEMAVEKGLHFEVIQDESLPRQFHADGLRLGQILRNLISNAIKFTEKGFVKLEVTPVQSSENLPSRFQGRTDMIGFYVKDSGIGVPSEKHKEIFDAFKQADGTTTRKFGGTGLGLAISRNFARLMGGDILLFSQPGQGSTFLLLLPLENLEKRKAYSHVPTPETDGLRTGYTHFEQTDQTETDTEPEPEPWTEETAVVDDRKNIRKGDTFLLIIEDDPAFAQILLDLAHEKNFKCMIAPNGETGLHYADYYGPSAIILDIGLPGIDGWEVMKRLQENLATRHIPVHFMSGSDKSLEALRKGAIGFLKKPVSVEEINEAFDHIEGLISKPLKRLLVVEDDEAMRMSIQELIGEDNIRISSVSSGQEAINLLKTESFDAMILDLGLEDMTGFELLQKIGKKNNANKIPIIIYTGKELTRAEEEKLQSYSDRIIIKGVKSPERLLAETTLFLHQVQTNLPEEKQKMLRSLHPKEDVMKDKVVLIVDDDMRNVFAVTSLLEDVGLKILVGKNGREGIDKLRSHSVDLVLMDIMMPEMNGYEAMEEIRKDPKFRKLPIIALTAKAMPGDREKCIQAGANDYLTKPIDSDKLISMLRVWLYQA